MPLSIARIVLYKHGVGYFEREGTVEGDATLAFTFKQAEVSDVLKSLTVLDLDGGHIASVSYDSTKPLEQLLAEVALSIPDEGSLVGLLPQIKGARVAVLPRPALLDPASRGHRSASTRPNGKPATASCKVRAPVAADRRRRGAFASTCTRWRRLQLLDAALQRDLDFYLRTQLSAKKKDARTFTFFAQGQGERTSG